MFIKDGQLPEDLLAKEKAGITKEESPLSEQENAASQEQMPPAEEYDPEYWYHKYEKPDIMDRLKIHMIDSGIFYGIFCLIYYLVTPGIAFNLSTFIIMYLVAVYVNAAHFFTWIFLLLTNGYTPGKYLYKNRVLRMDGKKLTFRDVFVRNFLMKAFCNAASCGMMNIASIIVAYVKPNSRPLHDISAGTITVQIFDRKKKKEKRVEFN